MHEVPIGYSTILSISFKLVDMMQGSFRFIKAAYNLRTQIAKDAEQIAKIVYRSSGWYGEADRTKIDDTNCSMGNMIVIDTEAEKNEGGR